MKRLTLFAVAVALVACGKKTDYTSAKLNTETVTNGGLTYTIAIPEGLPQDKHEAGSWDDAREEYDHIPKVFTSVYPLDVPKTVDEAKKEVPLSPDKGEFTRAEQKGGGWVVTLVKDKHRIEASSMTKVGDKIVQCHAIQNGDGDIDNFDKTKALLESICDSIKAK